MVIQPVLAVIGTNKGTLTNLSNQPSFTGYKFKLKTMYKKGLLPNDLIDIGGNKLTKQNVSGDHALAKSKGGRTTDDNMMLATKQFNSLRGNRPLKEIVTTDNLIKWSNQYLKLGKINGFDFVKYVQDVLKIIGEGK